MQEATETTKEPLSVHSSSFVVIMLKRPSYFLAHGHPLPRPKERSKRKGAGHLCDPASSPSAVLSPTPCGWGICPPFSIWIAVSTGRETHKKTCGFSALCTKYSTNFSVCTPLTFRPLPTRSPLRRSGGKKLSFRRKKVLTSFCGVWYINSRPIEAWRHSSVG